MKPRSRIHRKLVIEELETRAAPATDLAKLGLFLPEILKEHAAAGPIAGPMAAPVAEPLVAFLPYRDLVTIRDESILLGVYTTSSAADAAAQLQLLGMQVTATARAGDLNVIEGFMPLANVVSATGIPGVTTVAASLRPQSLMGSVTTQADTVMQVDLARLRGYDGSGITVGVLSDSANMRDAIPGGPIGIAESQATGDLPDSSRITILSDYAGPGSDVTDEGRAMMELIYDMAPGVNFAFHSAFNGDADFAQGIRELAAFGCRVIVDDVFYFNEPYFQDGIIAQAVTEVASGGVAYFSSAGNQSNKAYEQAFSGASSIVNGLWGYWHDFDPGPGFDFLQQVTLPANRSVVFILQWDEPWYTVGGVQSDLDFYVGITGAGAFLGYSGLDNIGSGQPIEGFSLNNSNPFPVSIDFAIQWRGGTRFPQLLKWVGYSSSLAINEYATNSATVGNHASALGGIGVAASPYYGPASPEPFTSWGPARRLFGPSGNRLPAPEIRYAPQITATDGGNTSFFWTDDAIDPDTFPNFYGTSAAAPGAAAVAAVLFSAVPTLTNTQVYTALQSTATDIVSTGVGFDNVTGYGLINARGALDFVLPPAPGAPDLLAVSDTGLLSTDNLTRLDNSAPANVLQFQVGGTVPGVLVRLYSGTAGLVGSAVASGSTTTITTNGTVDLADGVHVITATQTGSAGIESPASSGLSVTVDTVWPRIISSSPQGYITTWTGPWGEVVFDFSEAVDLSTLGMDDISGWGPQGNSIVGYLAYPTQLTVYFGGTYPGAYAVFVGPYIADYAGNFMDQNTNGIAGEWPEDRYESGFALLPWQTASLLNGQVILFDTDSANPAAADVSPSDVVVRTDSQGNILTLWVVGNPTGLGLVVNSPANPPALVISDIRRGAPLNDISFIAVNGSARQIVVRSDMQGWDIGNLLVGLGATGDADLDGDGLVGDATAIWVGGYAAGAGEIGTLRISGAVLQGDIVARNSAFSGAGGIGVAGVGSLLQSEVTVAANLGSLSVGGSFSFSRLNAGGNVNYLDLGGGAFFSSIGIGGNAGAIEVRSTMFGSALNIAGNAARVTVRGGLAYYSTISAGSVGALSVMNGLSMDSRIVVAGNVNDLRIGGGIVLNSLVDVGGHVRTALIAGAAGGPSVAAGSVVRIGSLGGLFSLQGELAGEVDIVGSAARATINLNGNLTGSLLAGLFGNVTVMGRFSGRIGDAGTAPGLSNVLRVTMPGGGGIVAPPNAFRNYLGYP